MPILPATFEPNRGITDARVDYLAHGTHYTLFLTATEIVLGLRRKLHGGPCPSAGGPVKTQAATSGRAIRHTTFSRAEAITSLATSHAGAPTSRTTAGSSIAMSFRESQRFTTERISSSSMIS